MEKKNTMKTKEDLVKFLEEGEFITWETYDYECNARLMADAVQFMWRSWYLEEMQPVMSDDCSYMVADYYDDVLHDVIVYETEIYWNHRDTVEEVADYLIQMNERYHYVKEKYSDLYETKEIIKKIFSSFKKEIKWLLKKYL